MNSNKKYAYCTVITNDNYTPCIILNKKIMEYLKCKYPFIVLVTDNVPKETIKKLEDNNIIVKNIEKFSFSYTQVRSNMQEISMIYAPLQLIDYDKIFFFEADICLLENCDNYFNLSVSKNKPFSFFKERFFHYHNFFPNPLTVCYVCKPDLNYYKLIVSLIKTDFKCRDDHDIATILFFNCMDDEFKSIQFLHFSGYPKNFSIDPQLTFKEKIDIDFVEFILNEENHHLFSDFIDNYNQFMRSKQVLFEKYIKIKNLIF